ncbi:MAG: beta-galactosidase [Clostridia bacterium]|nr:beta-galactosidase [Clostridia bacterium]
MKIDCSQNVTIRNPYFGVGMEKLDRDAFDPKDVIDRVAELGVKWVRIQSGWAKTEKEKGEYDILWLDEIVDGLLSRDLTPWICLCYGNPIYDERAKKIVGGVGCPPVYSEEAYNAWLAYCRAVAVRYKGKVEYYEIWNEPDGLWNGGSDPVSYAEFCKKTSIAVKEGDSEAKTIVGSVAQIDPSFALDCLHNGFLDGADAFSYHGYTYDERIFAELNGFYGRVIGKNGTKIIHGECGSQSRNGGNGAFKGFSTDETKQAKQLLRQMVTDRSSGIFFSSYFSATDMHENLFAKAGKPIKKHGYFGLLSASFDEKGTACAPFQPKPSYYAYQNLCAFLPEEAKSISVPYWISRAKDDRTARSLFLSIRKRLSKRIGKVWHDDRLAGLVTRAYEKDGATTFLYWLSTDLVANRKKNLMVEATFIEEREPKLVDLLTGEVAGLAYVRDGKKIKTTLPVRDYPIAVEFGDFVKTV